MPASLSATFPGSVYTIASDSSIWHYNSRFGWFPITGAGFSRQLSAREEASGTEVVFSVDFNNTLWFYTATDGWNFLGSFISQISSGLDSQGFANCWVITTGNQPARFDFFSGWAILGGAGTTLALSAAGNNDCYFLGTDHSILGFTTGWFALSGSNFSVQIQATTDAAGQTAVFSLSPSQVLYMFHPTTSWVTLGQGIKAIGSAGTGASGEAAVFVTTVFNQPYQFTPVTGWLALAGPNTPFLEMSAAQPANGQGFDTVFVIAPNFSVLESMGTGFFPVTAPGFARGPG